MSTIANIGVAIVVALMLTPGTTLSQSRTPWKTLGHRDPYRIGLEFGSTTGIAMDVSVPIDETQSLRLGGAVGAGIAIWGVSLIAEGEVHYPISVWTDRSNDALLLGPVLGFGYMEGHSENRLWFDLTPKRNVYYLTLSPEGSWIHEYRSWSLDLSLLPGLAYACSGVTDRADLFSLRLSVALAARF